jgi:hypothetical protein
MSGSMDYGYKPSTAWILWKVLFMAKIHFIVGTIAAIEFRQMLYLIDGAHQRYWLPMYCLAWCSLFFKGWLYSIMRRIRLRSLLINL